MHKSNELLFFSKRLSRFNSTLIPTLQEHSMEQQAAPVYLLIGTPTYRHFQISFIHSFLSHICVRRYDFFFLPYIRSYAVRW